jgi:predicted metal-dependent hydrolase
MPSKILHWEELPILLTQKRIKNIYLIIKPGGIIEVRAPLSMSVLTIKKFIESKSKWILKHKRLSEGKSSPESIVLSPSQKKEWRDKLFPLLFDFVSIWQKKMKTPPIEVKIKWMKTRWGTCNPWKKVVTFNLALASKPNDCIEYVVVHELAHLFERKHNARYYKILDNYLPDHRMLRKKLNQTIS